jgi:hypothetical protein
MADLFGGVRAPSTLGSFLRSFTWGNGRQMVEAACELMLHRYFGPNGPHSGSRLANGGTVVASGIITGALVALAGIAALILVPKVWGGYFSRRQTRFRGLNRPGESKIFPARNREPNGEPTSPDAEPRRATSDRRSRSSDAHPATVSDARQRQNRDWGSRGRGFESRRPDWQR